jgi:hypothetical protein
MSGGARASVSVARLACPARSTIRSGPCKHMHVQQQQVVGTVRCCSGPYGRDVSWTLGHVLQQQLVLAPLRGQFCDL